MLRQQQQNLWQRILTACVTYALIQISLAHAETGFSALVIEPSTNRILYEYNANQTRYPASLTKVMTLYVVFDALKNKKTDLRQLITFSSNAVQQKPSKLGAKKGESISLDLAIKALIVKSANDVAVAVAENIAGSESAFIMRMNATAKKLGMQQSFFVNPHGLPDAHNQQTSSARDMAILAAHIQNDFPMYAHYFSIKQYEYKGKTTETHNRVLLRFPGADGMKTGYIKKSGFNVITTAKRNNKRLIGVVFGGKNSAERDNFMMIMLEKSYSLLFSNPSKSARIALDVDPNIMVRVAAENPPKNISNSPTLLASKKNNTQLIKPIKIKPTFPEPSHLNQKNKTKTASKKEAPNIPYALQVGTYSIQKNARAEAHNAIRILGKGRAKVIEIQNKNYRALVVGFNQTSAMNACQILKSKKRECFTQSYP